jgi:hypothetical protein
MFPFFTLFLVRFVVAAVAVTATAAATRLLLLGL